MRAPNVVSEPPHVERDLGVLFGHTSGFGNRDVYAGHVSGRRDEAVHDQRFRQRDRCDPLNVGVGQAGGVLNQILDDQVVTLRPGVLKVGDGVDAAGVRNLPGGVGKLFDGPQRVAREDGAVSWREDDERVLVLAVDLLEVFKRLQIRVGSAEEDPGVAGGGEARYSPSGGNEDDQRADDNPPSPADDSLTKSRRHRSPRFELPLCRHNRLNLDTVARNVSLARPLQDTCPRTQAAARAVEAG